MLAALMCGVFSTYCDIPGPHKNYLGVRYVSVSDSQPSGPGALITAVEACSPANTAGIHVGDIITAIGDRAVTGEDLNTILESLPQYATITVRVVRGNKLQTLRTKLWRTSEATYPSAAPYFGVGSIINDNGWVKIGCIYPKSPADVAGLHSGDRITSIDGATVTVANYHKVLTHFDAGTTVPVGVICEGVSRTVNVRFSDDDSPVEELEVKGVQLLDDTVERVIDVEEVPLNNCLGNATLESQRTFSKKVTRQVALSLDGELEMFGAAPFVLAQAKIAATYDYNSSDELSESKTEIMRAAPRTFVTYVVTWYEISRARDW